MHNALIGDILQNIVTEKVVRDKIIMQQKQQREQQERNKKRDQEDELDQFDDQETRAIMLKMKNQYNNQTEQGKKQQKRTIGQYREITEAEFLDYTTKFKHTLVHFYHPQFERCKIMDKHLQKIAYQYPQVQFLYLNALKAPFFVQRLNIRTLPTLCIFHDGVLKDKVLGFEGLSGGDDFKTHELTGRLVQAGLIECKFKLTKGKEKRNNESDEQND